MDKPDPNPALRRLPIRWWPLVRLMSEQRPAAQRWRLGEKQTGSKKILLLTSPRGRQWRVLLGIRPNRGTWIEPLPQP